MSRVRDVLKQLEDVMFMKNEAEDREDFVDFPYIEDPEEYKTHRPFEDPYGRPFSTEDKVREQEEEEEPAGVKPEELDPSPEKPKPEEAEPEEAEPGAEEMPEEEPLDIDTALGEQEEPLTAKEIGRVFELKKIYSRLVSMEAYLSSNVDTEMLELRNKISQSINLFEVVIANFDSYKEKIDDIIITFYKLIKMVYSMLRDYYKKDAKEEGM